MSRTRRFFRALWRINAILILVAAAGVSFAVISFLVSQLDWSSARRREAAAAPQVGESQAGERLFLGRVSVVPGTTVLRGELQVHRSGSGFSSGSGGYLEVRNLLFVKDRATEGHWLLPDNDHAITEREDVGSESHDRGRQVPVATVVLVKPAHQDFTVSDGELLLLDPSGDRVQTVATGVRDLHTAAVQDTGLLLLFERNRKYVLAVFDVPSLTKKEERELDVPPLK
jgi:hypothetical protein